MHVTFLPNLHKMSSSHTYQISSSYNVPPSLLMFPYHLSCFYCSPAISYANTIIGLITNILSYLYFWFSTYILFFHIMSFSFQIFFMFMSTGFIFLNVLLLVLTIPKFPPHLEQFISTNSLSSLLVFN